MGIKCVRNTILLKFKSAISNFELVSLTKKNYPGKVKKTIKINASRDKVWAKISNIVGLSSWVIQVKKTVFLSKKKRGTGAIRKITFDDGNVIVEHIVLWENKKSFSYIATSGLPLQTYVATFAIRPINRNSVNLSWQSYFITKKMTKKQFSEFQTFMGIFYSSSLKSLKKILEKECQNI